MNPIEFRAHRLALGLNQATLADLLDVKQNTISRWEKGTAPIPEGVGADLLALAREMAELEVQLAANAQESAQQQRRIATNLLTLDFTTDQQRPSRLSRIGEAAAGLLDNGRFVEPFRATDAQEQGHTVRNSAAHGCDDFAHHARAVLV